MRIGLISDTHAPQRLAKLPPALFDALSGVDLLLHAGDVGELWVVDQLSSIAPVIAVHGNDDSADAQRELPYQQVVAIAGRRILLCHSHYPDRAEELASRRVNGWQPKLDRLVALGAGAQADALIFGHTHIPMAREQAGMLLVNPGAIASGNATTRQRRQTVARLTIEGRGGFSVEHIDLAHPHQIYTPHINWDAGFAAALNEYSESILASDLAAVWDELSALVRPLGTQPYLSALLRVSHRVWAGQQAAITRSDLLGELEAEAGIPAGARTQIRKILDGGGV